LAVLGLFIGMASVHAYQPMGLVPGQYRVVGGQIIIPAVCLDMKADTPASTNQFSASRGEMVFRTFSGGETVREITVQKALETGVLTIIGNDTFTSVKAVVANPQVDETYVIDVREFSVVGRDADHVAETSDTFAGTKGELTGILSGHLRAMAPIKDKVDLGGVLYKVLQEAIWKVQAGEIRSEAQIKESLPKSVEDAIVTVSLLNDENRLLQMVSQAMLAPEEQQEQLVMQGIESFKKDNPAIMSRKQVQEGLGRGLTDADFRVIDGIFGTKWSE
jgi:hypothetical protein